MISNLKTGGVSKLELVRFQKKNIFQVSVKAFQDNQIEENEYSEIISAELQKSKALKDIECIWQ